MKIQKKIKDIIAEECKKHGIPAHIGEKMYGIPWKMLRDETSKHFGNWDATAYPTVQIPAFGMFQTSQKKLNTFKESKKEE